MRPSAGSILLVEDEALIAMEQARLLREEGYGVSHVTSGEKAIAAIRAQPEAIDLILMDIDLGRGMDGARAAREILKEHDIPVLFLSAHTEKEVVAKTEKITSYGYVVKDSGFTVLSASIKMAFKLHRALRELEKRERALRESQERFSKAFEHAAIGMALVLPDGRWLKVNPSLCGIVGYSEKELLTKSFQDITHPDDLEADLDYFRRTLAGEIPNYQKEKRYFHKTGRIVWVRLSVSLVRDDRGTPLYFICQIEDVTGSKKAEAVLRENERNFEQLIRLAPIPMWFVNRKGVLKYFNDRFLKTFGYTHEDIPTVEEWRRRAYPDEPYRRRVVESWEAAVKRAALTGADIEPIEGRVTCKDGAVRIIEISGIMIADDLLQTFIDITDRKKAEDALRASEARYRSLFDHMEEGVAYCRMLFDKQGLPRDFVYLAVNPAFERLTGLKDVVGKNVSVAIPGIKEQTPELFEVYGRVARTGRAEKIEINFTPLDIWLSISVYSPELGCFVAVFENITGRKRTEEEARKAQLLLKSSIESPKEVIILSIDKQYRYLYFNAWHKDVMRAAYTSDVRIGMNLLECISAEDDRQKAKFNYDRALAGESHSTIEEYGDIERFYYETFYSPIIDENGETIGATAFARNVTDRKRAEAALKESVRQKEVLMKELQHRVKNSLAVVSGLLGLEMENLADARSREVFVSTRSRIRSISSLYEQLYGTADVAHVDLRRYISHLVETLLDTYAPKTGNIKLTMELDEVTLDTKRAVPLGLILNELVMNAIKYAHPPGEKGNIRVVLERSADRITLGVSDDGVGLPEGFDPQTSGGTGWSLVRMLANEIDGRLTVASGAGCRVSLAFDLKEA
ncbi:MAG: PAS domain S-box protein [Candidatus Aminicenantales bacterium]